MAKPTYQLKITLLQSKPKIWRTILVKPETSLVDMHCIIQTTMGWTNSHLHLFDTGVTQYAPKEFEVEGTKNSRTTKLNKVLNTEKQIILYQYDFGDGWEHEILLEKIVEDDGENTIPCCIAGKGNCPPEDCGGVYGYEAILKIIKDKKNKEYDDTMEWLGEDFDPAYFDLKEINELLKTENYGCIWL